MKCPLLAFAWGNEGGKEPLVYPDCLKEECAWWSTPFEMCDINILTQELWELRQAITTIAEKMPHVDQFTK